MSSPEPMLQRVRESCGTPCLSPVSAESLHRDCFCLAVDPDALRDQLNAQLADSGSPVRLAEAHRHLFSALPVFVPQATLAAMTAAVRAISAVAATPAWRDAVLAWAPAIAAHDPGSPGGLLGFDFHLAADGPRLIEINTNPGGLLLNAMLARAQRLCLPALSVPAPDGVEGLAVEVLLEEWREQGSPQPDGLVAIVDVAPEQQYLYAEFVMYRRLLEERGRRVVICDPADLAWHDGALRHAGERVGLVYNRLTDFALAEPASQALREAWLAGAVALSPHPRAHALWADKRNLGLLRDRDFLAGTDLPAAQQALVADVVPATRTLTPGNRDELWAGRRDYFFKPASGFGSRASYRGDKLTRGTWEAMQAGTYVAQRIVPPSERHAAPGERPLKVDIRCWAWRGEALFFAARLYQGQTTNFRTAGGGFAPVLTLIDAPVGAVTAGA